MKKKPRKKFSFSATRKRNQNFCNMHRVKPIQVSRKKCQNQQSSLLLAEKINTLISQNMKHTANKLKKLESLVVQE